MSNEIYNKCKDSIVGILSKIDGNFYIGTGFFINESTIATAGHNLFSADYEKQQIVRAEELILTITNYNSCGKTRVIKTNNFYIDGAADIGIIKVEPIQNQTYINFDYTFKTQPGDSVYLIGNPAGIDFQSICKGMVRNPKHIYESNGIETMLLDITGMQGNSGSPILNKDGNAIGIFTYGFSSDESRMGGGPGIEYCRPAINFMMNRNRDYFVKRNSGVLIWEAIQSKHFIKKDFPNFDLCGIKILYLADYSPFKTAGLEEGDVILEIDGEKIGFFEGQSHINNVMWRIKKDKIVKVKYVKKNKFNKILETDVNLNISFKQYPIMDNYDYLNYLYDEIDKQKQKEKKNKKQNKSKNNKKKN